MVQINDFLVEPKLQLINFSCKGDQYFHFQVYDPVSAKSGSGDSVNIALAQTKAVFEYIERYTFSKYGGNARTSSGWAAHSSLEAARRSADLELIERDAVLCCWLQKKSPKIIDSLYFPKFNRKFYLLKLGEWMGNFIISAIVERKDTSKRMWLSAAGPLDQCREKLLCESERAYLLMDESNRLESPLVEHSEAFNQYTDDELAWIYQDGEGVFFPESISFIRREFEALLWNGAKAWIVHSSSDDLQELFYGNPGEQLNTSRLSSLGRIQNLNQSLHPLL